jgi:CDP-paratose 2-epimerase
LKALVTGAAGLVGYYACENFSELGFEVQAVDNFMRRRLFGSMGDTRSNARALWRKHHIRVKEIDVRSKDLRKLVKASDVIIHAASQPSHPKSIEIPELDESINIDGTLNVLEGVRQNSKEAVVIFCSTNKVYGENVHRLPVVEQEKRYDYAKGIQGVDETMPVDQTLHTPFGVSKLAADLYCQEYARLYRVKTGIFRLSCITGPRAKAVEAQNWEPYFVRKNIRGETLNVFGYGGKQVRDIMDARDLVEAFDEFIACPRAGEVYNMGGGRENSISLLESFDVIESTTGRKMLYELRPKRQGDHMIYISNLAKFKDHYPAWSIKYNINRIFTDIYEEVRSSRTS